MRTFVEHFPQLSIPTTGQVFPDLEITVFNEELGLALGITHEKLQERLRAPSGHALGYAGHQFGQLQPVLGDGRALLLDTRMHCDTGMQVELHIKGSGPTVFARGGDGFAAYGPMLREYLMAEWLHHLGVPTTRALAVARTGKKVQRGQVLHGAVVVRAATTHVRVGTLQLAAMRSTPTLEQLVRYMHQLHQNGGAPVSEIDTATDAAQCALELFDTVIDAHTTLVAKWMRLGFVHGVLNTDNVQLFGETIDFGPCAWLDAYQPEACFSSIDSAGRYRFEQQPWITGWNMARLAECLIPMVSHELLQARMESFTERYQHAFECEMLSALGLPTTGHNKEHAALVQEFTQLLAVVQPDLTSTMRALAEDETPTGFEEWVAKWRSFTPDLAAMRRINPVYVPRNHLIEEALAGDPAPLLQLLQNPFERVAGMEYFAAPPATTDPNYRTFCGT